MIRLIILRILESYFQHRWLYLLPIVVLGLAGTAYEFIREPEYITGGTLYVKKESFLASLTSVRDSDAGWWVTPAELTVAEISELMQTEAFMRSVIMETDLAPRLDMDIDTVLETFEEARASIWMQAMGDNQIFIGGLNTDPNVAFQLVNTTIENYVQWKINADLIDSQGAQEFFDGLIVEYQADIDEIHGQLEAYLASHPEPVRGERPDLEELEISRLESELDMAEKRMSKALDKDEDARLAASQAESDARQTYLIIDAPYLPDAPNTSLTTKAVNIIVFGVIGAVLSVVGIAVGAVLDRSFRFPVDVHQTVNLPVLTTVPDLTPDQGKQSRRARRKEAKAAQTPAEGQLVYGMIADS